METQQINKYDFFEDPYHGWVKVNIKELEELGIAEEISEFSYMDEEFVYLEEDADLSTFGYAKEKIGPKLEFTMHLSEGPSPIRKYKRYKYLRK